MLLSLLSTVAFAQAELVSVSGSLDGTEPTYNRTFADFSGLSGTGTAVFYDLHQVVIPEDGAYSFGLSADATDTYLFVYSSFDPADPMSNGVGGDDDDGDFFHSRVDVVLAPGTYTVVVTTFGNGELYNYDLVVDSFADGDADGVYTPDDLCPAEDSTGFDANADGCVDDTDSDGVGDDVDACPAEDATGFDQDGDGCIDDTDSDGIPDDVDACPAEDATGFDQDGDGCIDDSDGDGIDDDLDACPAEDASGYDADSDGCIDDTDGDGFDDVEDTCPITANPGQADADGDGIGNRCELDLSLVGTGARGTSHSLSSTGPAGARIGFFISRNGSPPVRFRSRLVDGDGTADVSFKVPYSWAPGDVITLYSGTGTAVPLASDNLTFVVQ